MSLSQDEIDKLASEGDDNAGANAQVLIPKVAAGLVHSVQNIIPILVSAKKVEISAQDSTSNPLSAGIDSIEGENSFCYFTYEALCDGPWIVYVSNSVALEISQKMMGQEGAEELNEALLSALVEAMNNILGAYSTSLIEEFGIDGITQGEVKFIETATAEAIATETGLDAESLTWLTRMPLVIDEIQGEIGLLLTDACLSAMLEKHPEAESMAVAAVAAEEAPVETQQSADEPSVTPAAQAGAQEAPVAVFEDLEPRKTSGEAKGIDLILDVPLNVTVELGRKHLSVKDILALTPGSLVELEKLAGEAVDILVNGKLFAKGEVVVIDENFGVRVSTIVTPLERVQRMGAE